MFGYVLAFSREAGGAEVIAPIIKNLKKEFKILLLAKDFAKDRFDDHSLEYVELNEFSNKNMEDICTLKFGSLPAVLLTSMASMSFLDNTERYLWKWAKENGIKSVAVLDHWSHYEERFSGAGKNERMKYFPDKVAVMDKIALKELVEVGVPENTIEVTGHPALESLLDEKISMLDERDAVRKDIGIKGNQIFILYASECIHRDFGDTLGYDERSSLELLISALSKVAKRNPELSIILGIKLHPHNRIEDLGESEESIKSSAAGFDIKFYRSEKHYRDFIVAADIVTGMISMLLIESVLFGIPTVSIQPDFKGKSELMLSRSGVLNPFQDIKLLEEKITGILLDGQYRSNHLSVQNKFVLPSDAIKNITNLVLNISSEGAQI